jgi:hypothetical protein
LQRAMEQQQKEQQQTIAELTARVRALEPRP